MNAEQWLLMNDARAKWFSKNGFIPESNSPFYSKMVEMDVAEIRELFEIAFICGVEAQS